MLYTRKGDNGTTKTFGCDQRISKSSKVAEALGSLDEANSYIGFARAKCSSNFSELSILNYKFEQILLEVQQNLFIVQAELAGAKEKTINHEKVLKIEKITDSIEKELPPIKSFFIPGTTELGAMFDVVRTIVRRAERRVIGVHDEGLQKVGKNTISYLNRLSSLFFGLARLVSHKSGIKEESPSYK